MKTAFSRRLLATLLVVAMCLSVLPVMAFAATSSGDTISLYRLDTTLEAAKGSNSNYATSGEVTVNNVTWNVSGNITMNPWRIGGKSIENQDRVIYSKTPVEGISKVVNISLGAINATMNSVKLQVADNADFTNAAEYAVTDAAASHISVVEITPVENAYFKIIINVTVASTSNKYVQFSGIEIEGSPSSATTEPTTPPTEPVTEPVTEPITEPTVPTEPETDIVPISTALAGATGSTFTVQGVVTLIDGKNVYVQDSTGGICLYLTTAPEGLSRGDVVIGTGARADYNSLPELSNATYEISENAELTLSAKEVTIGQLTSSDVCTFVKLTGLTVTEVYDNSGKFTSPNVTVKDAEGKTIQIYKAHVQKNEDGTWAVKVDDVIDIVAAVGINKGTLQLRTGETADITIKTVEPDPTEPVQPTDPTDPVQPTDPTEPVQPTDPTDPVQPTDPTEPAQPAMPEGYVTSMDTLTSGTYVIVLNNGYAMGVLDGGWITAVMPVITEEGVTDAKGGVWTVTVNDDGTVTLTDSNGTTVAPKGGNTNGIISGSYSWKVTCEEGKFIFYGLGDDTVLMASNPGWDNRFRAYKLTSVADFPHEFYLYPVVAAEEPTDPTDPSEPSDPTEPTDPSEIRTITPGTYVIDFGGKYATAIAANRTYGYLYTKEAISATEAFTFTLVSNARSANNYTFYIQQSDGRYLLQTGTYNSFNLSEEIVDGCEWTVIVQPDGTALITNTSVKKTIGYSEQYTSAGSYPSTDGYILPVLTAYNDEEETTDPTEPSEPTEPAPSEPVHNSQTDIVDRLYELEPGEVLENQTLTGTITEINYPYSEQYKNITVTIVVAGREDKPVYCYRIKGEGAEHLKVGDVITVTGPLTNYNGQLYEFTTPSTFVMGPAATGDNSVVILAVVLMALSAAGVAVLVIGKKKLGV